MGKIGVNESQCKNIAKVIKRLKFRPNFLKKEVYTFSDDKETKARVYFYVTAICHQTRKLISKRRNLMGWDYLMKVFIELSRNEPEFLEPKNIISMKKSDLELKLKILFSDDNKHTTLDRIKERADFLIDCAQILERKYSGSVLRLLDESQGYLINNDHGLYKLLEQFKSYRDPLRKKSGVFLEFLADSNVFRIKDSENFFPIIDYHIQRVLLRMGCIEINDEYLRKKLVNFEKIKSDEEIRKASQGALMKISKFSGMTVLKFDPVFWSLGRSCCNKKTLCYDKTCNKNPCTFYTFFKLDSHNKCIFEKVCKGSTDERYRKLMEPNIETNYY